MSVAKVIPISPESATSIEDDVQQGIDRPSDSVEGVESASTGETEALVRDGKVRGWRVNLQVKLVLED